MKTGIIGAGASGLSLALMLDGEFTVFEQRDRTGGHCHTTIRDGWTFDQGPHIMFSKNADVLNFMIKSLGENVHQSTRNNKVFVDRRMVKYPFENDLASLELSSRTRCLLTFLFNDHAELAKEPANLSEWFLGHFGEGMTDLYFRPYNEKVWNIALEDLSMTWSERIPLPPAADVVRGALGESTEGYLHQLHYHYPLEGGYQAITDAWTKRIAPASMHLNTRIKSIERVADGVTVTSDAGSVTFDRVVSTVPLPTLLELTGDVPDRVRDAVASLQINPVNVVTLGYRGVNRDNYTAVYFAGDEYLPNRVSGPSVFSPRNAPDGHFSLQAEITYPPGDGFLEMTDADLVAHVHDGIVDAGMVDRASEPVFVDVQRMRHAYVVYTKGYEAALSVVREWSKSLGIELHGRFGSFDYLNVDGCVAKSQALATVLNGRATALPTVANSEPS
jgi:protoporphyrinogen oxidase